MKSRGKKMLWRKVIRVLREKKRQKEGEWGSSGEQRGCESGRIEYFDDFFNFREERKAEMDCLRRAEVESERRRGVASVNEEKLLKVLKKMKNGKSAG